MEQFEKYITQRLTLISLISAIFMIYPNIICFPFVLPNPHTQTTEFISFLGFFTFRFLFFWTLVALQINYNIKQIPEATLAKKLLCNIAISIVAYLIFAPISYWVSHKYCVYTDFLGSTLPFQFFVSCLLCTSVGCISTLYHAQRKKEMEIERLRSENLQSRCEALTNQINPHFFFNSLNAIASLIRKKDDEKTLVYVEELSDIFRYILQSEHKGVVSLREELDFVEAFIYVMEVRFANKLKVEIKVPEVEKETLRLPVLSILPLIDNVVVHNIIDSEHIMHVEIILNKQNELVVSNLRYAKPSPADTNGTGLNNLNSRFKLLMGKQITIKQDETHFTVTLPLNKDRA